MESSKQEILSLLKELIRFANADRQYREMENNFLLAIAEQLGIAEDEFQALFDAHIDYTPPTLEFERIVQFQRLVLLMNVDHETNETEIHKLKEFGMLLGLNPEAVNEVLVQMKLHENGMLSPEKLIEIFKVHHN